MEYRALYVFLRLGKNDGYRNLSINIRPSLGVLLKANISRVGQDLKVRTDVALKLAKKMSL